VEEIPSWSRGMGAYPGCRTGALSSKSGVSGLVAFIVVKRNALFTEETYTHHFEPVFPK